MVAKKIAGRTARSLMCLQAVRRAASSPHAPSSITMWETLENELSYDFILRANNILHMGLNSALDGCNFHMFAYLIGTKYFFMWSKGSAWVNMRIKWELTVEVFCENTCLCHRALQELLFSAWAMVESSTPARVHVRLGVFQGLQLI